MFNSITNKSHFMNTNILQQEILLLTGTTFSQRQLSENDAKDERSHLSASEKLEEACWTGLLDELLPEIVTNKKRIMKRDLLFETIKIVFKLECLQDYSLGQRCEH